MLYFETFVVIVRLVHMFNKNKKINSHLHDRHQGCQRFGCICQQRFHFQSTRCPKKITANQDVQAWESKLARKTVISVPCRPRSSRYRRLVLETYSNITPGFDNLAFHFCIPCDNRTLENELRYSHPNPHYTSPTPITCPQSPLHVSVPNTQEDQFHQEP